MVTELREHCFIVKDTDEQPTGDVHRVRSGGVWNIGASVPLEEGVHHLPDVHQPNLLVVLWRFCSALMDSVIGHW